MLKPQDVCLLLKIVARGPLVQGMRTAESAAPLVGLLPPSHEPPSVWPDPTGDVRGITLEPP